MARLLTLLTLITAWIFAVPALAAPQNPFLVRGQGATLAPGAKGEVTLTLVVPPGHHVYRDMMEVTVDQAGGLSFGAASFPPGEFKPDPLNDGAQREQFEHDVIVEVPVTAPAKDGAYTATLKFRYQGCKDTLCYMPATDAVDLTVTVQAGAAAPAAGSDGGTASATGAPAEGGDPSAPPAADKVVRLSAGPAEAGKAVIAVDLTGGWHINRDMVGVRTATEGGPVTVGTALEMPAGEPYNDPASGFSRTDLTTPFTLKAPLTGPDGAHELDLLVTVQVCKEGLCLMPTDLPVHVSATIGAAAASTASPVASAPSAGGAEASVLDRRFEEALQQGIGPLFLFVFMSGVLVSFTPCVLPMVPITVGIIGARSAASRLEGIALAASYVAGLTLVYTLLIVGAALTGSMFGAWMQSPWVVGAIGVFFFAMGLAMFGLFDVGMPSSIQTKLSQYGGSGFRGAFVVGMVGALTAGPCSGPVVLSIIALIARLGQVWLGALLGVAFSLGLGLIFLVAGAFSSVLLRPGPWMETVKKSFGLIMWAGALYFVAPQLSDTLTALIASAMLLVTAAFTWPENDEEHGFWVARSRKLYSVVAGIVGAYLLIGVLVTRGFILEPMQLTGLGGAGAAEAAKPGVVWGSDEPAALTQAKSENKPIMIDFTADWCAACKELEHYTYTDPGVISASLDFVPVMIDATRGDDPKVKALLEKYEVAGLPTVKFLAPDGSTLSDLTVTGFIPASEFLPRMEAARARSGG